MTSTSDIEAKLATALAANIIFGAVKHLCNLVRWARGRRK